MIRLTNNNFDKFVDAFSKALHEVNVVQTSNELSSTTVNDSLEMENTDIFESEIITFKFRTMNRLNREKFWAKVERYMIEMN